MKYSIFVLVLLWMFLVIPAAAVETAIDELIPELKMMEFSRSRVPFTQVEQLINASAADPSARGAITRRLAELLDSEEATKWCKDFVLRQMKRIGTDREVPTIAVLLTDKQLGQMARYALEGIQTDTAQQAMIDALDKTDGHLRIGLIHALGHVRAAGAVSRIDTLLSSSDRQTAVAAAWALGQIATVEAAASIENAMQQSLKAELNAALAQAYLFCAETYQQAGGDAEAMFDMLLSEQRPPHVRAAAFRNIVDNYPDRSLAALRTAIDEQCLYMLRMAARVSRDIDGQPVTEMLVGRLPDLSGDVQVAFVSALAVRDDAMAFEAIVDQLDSPSLTTRLAALQGLIARDDAAVPTLLIRQAARSTGQEKQDARRLLYEMDLEDPVRFLKDEYQADGPDKRIEVIRALAAKNLRAALPLLFDAVEDPDRRVRQEAWRAIGQLGHVEHIYKIAELYAGLEIREMRLGQNALVSVAHRTQLRDVATDTLLAMQYALENTDRQRHIIETLAQLGSPAGFEQLKTALQDDNQDIQMTALRGLANWPDATPLNLLYEIAQTTEDTSCKIIALRGFIRQVGMADLLSAEQKVKHLQNAMQMAPRVTEKRQVISALADIPSLPALQLVLDVIGDDDLRREAEVAAVSIAEDTVHTYPHRTAEAMESILAVSANDSVLDSAAKVLAIYEENRNYLTVWQVSAPYTVESNDLRELFDTRFPPESQHGEVISWTRISAGTSPDHPFMVDLHHRFSVNHSVAYCRKKVWSDQQRPVRVEIGSDDGFKFWINETLYGKEHASRGWMPAQNVFEAKLDKGWNLVMIKVTQDTAGWAFSVKMTEQDGSPIPDQKSSIDIENEDLPLVFEPFFPGPVMDIEGSRRFERMRIGRGTFEAASAFDINNNGIMDIYSGEFWYEGPDFERKHKVGDIQQVGDYYDDFSNFPMDVNGNGYLDVITGGWFGLTLRWRENPKGQPVEWPLHDIAEVGHIETTRFWDINGDGYPEIVPNLPGNKQFVFQLVRDENGKGTGEFNRYVISEDPSGHGVGFGDVNGNGRGDIVMANGWLEAPERPFDQDWTFHPEFNLGSASVPIIVHDVNGNGKADLIVGQAHGYGLHWWEQSVDEQGNRIWIRHDIDPNRSQYHDMMMADITGDGHLELVTGKRYLAHGGGDPGAFDPVGIYYFKIENGAFKRVTLDYGPADEHSGAGIYFWVDDITGNGFNDVLAPGKEGLYLFKNKGPKG